MFSKRKVTFMNWIDNFNDIDTKHGLPEKTAEALFWANSKRFVEGIDYKAGKLSRSGYFKLTKLLRDDLSWEIQSHLSYVYDRAEKNKQNAHQAYENLVTLHDAMGKLRELVYFSGRIV